MNIENLTNVEKRRLLAKHNPEIIMEIKGAWFYVHQGIGCRCKDNDPLHDSHAIREIEKLRNNDRDHGPYIRALVQVVLGLPVHEFSIIKLNHWALFRVVKASAPQRADALLMSI